MAGKKTCVSNRKRCRAGEPNVSMKRLRDEVCAIRGRLRDEVCAIRGQLSEIQGQLSAMRLQASPPTFCEDPSDYGQKLRAALPQPDISSVPRPVSPRRADSILRSFETCLDKQAGKRICEDDFRKWMSFIKEDQCKFVVQYTGNVSRLGRKTKMVDFSIVYKGRSAIDLYTGALFALLSHEGKFNGDRVLGEFIMRAGILLTSWRPKVILGLTNGIDVEWFTLKMEQGAPSLQVSPVYPFRESLCGLLVADPSSLYLSFMDIPELNLGAQIGVGRTSWVFSANHRGRDVVAKIYRREFDFVLEEEAKTLKQLKDVMGIPRVVKKDPRGRYLLMTPIGKSLASTDCFEGWHVVYTQLVDILEEVHAKGIIHRDIRSANILLVKEDTTLQALLIDWGFACAAGEEKIFAGSVATGSNQLLRQLSHCSESPSVSRPSKQRRSGDAEDLSESPSKASTSQGVQTRSKARLSEMERSCCLGPEDDLVSLVKTSLLMFSKSAKEQVRQIAADDYQTYLDTWSNIMEARPRWKEAQDYAEVCDYVNVKKFLCEALINFMS